MRNNISVAMGKATMTSGRGPRALRGIPFEPRDGRLSVAPQMILLLVLRLQTAQHPVYAGYGLSGIGSQGQAG